ncbi:MAG: SDR family NAD(P)-dependent oxidoreductase, partial [Porticoccaceae bacterium]|nr:SDR family NAD(P)-dependent oxidoreductase [Porticoccaceae bacterium]
MSREIPPYVAGHQLLAGKHILITAAAGAGIGFSAAKRAVEEGAATVVLSDIHEGRLQQAVENLAALNTGCQVQGIVANVTNEEQVQHLVDEAERLSGGIDVLINNAGLGGTCRLVDMQDEAWDRVIDISLTGTMRMMRAMLRYMQ